MYRTYLSQFNTDIEKKNVNQAKDPEEIDMQFHRFLSALMVFVTDCDNTLVHYESSPSSSSTITEELVLYALPASSGSGKIATVSSKTIELLDQIGELGTTIICATGMRASTMHQRAPYFPSIHYFAVENGGRVFQRHERGGIPVELNEWRQRILHDGKAKELLDVFASMLTSEGWAVDTNDYHTMVRIKGKDVESLVSRIPQGLTHTFNLGYLDVQLPGCSKLAATQWIIAQLNHRRVTASSPPVVVTEDDHAFLFMGDDDNDVEIAASSREAFIAQPCSAAMQSFVDTWETVQSAGDSSTGGNKTTPILTSAASSEDVSTLEGTGILDGKEQPHVTEDSAKRGSDGVGMEGSGEWYVEGRPVIARKVHVAPFLTHKGTEALLALVLTRLQRRNNDISNDEL